MVEQQWWNSYSGTVRWNGNGEPVLMEHYSGTVVVKKLWYNSNGVTVLVEKKW